MTPIDPKLIGSWISLDEMDESEEDEEYSPAIFTISAQGDTYQVAAVSPTDGEAAQITNLTWDGEWLAFDCIFPSTDYPTKQAISLQPDGDAKALYTIWEIWKKIDAKEVAKMPAQLEKSAAAAGAPAADPSFTGIWVTEDEDSEATFAISIGENGYEVAGFDRFGGDSFGVKNVQWDGEALSFEVYLDEDDLLSKNTLRLNPDLTAELQLTLYDTWRKVIAVDVEE